MTESFLALTGGVIVGFAATILLIFHGKIMGISGIIGKLFLLV